MMATRHKIDFMIRWLHLQFAKHCVCLTVLPAWLGSCCCQPHARSLIDISDSHSSLARWVVLAPFSRQEMKAWGDLYNNLP